MKKVLFITVGILASAILPSSATTFSVGETFRKPTDSEVNQYAQLAKRRLNSSNFEILTIGFHNQKYQLVRLLSECKKDFCRTIIFSLKEDSAISSIATIFSGKEISVSTSPKFFCENCKNSIKTFHLNGNLSKFSISFDEFGINLGKLGY